MSARRNLGFLLTLAITCGTVLGAVGSTAVAQPAPTPAPTPYVDPELRNAVQAMQDRMRNAQAGANQQRPPPASPQTTAQNIVAQRHVTVPNGAPDVLVHVINGGKKGAPRPAILHMHGGGYTGGTAAFFFSQLIPLAQTLDCVIVSVDYRLAPATPYPGSLEDNYAALTWLYRNAAELGVDASRIAVMGESAGGGHAAMPEGAVPARVANLARLPPTYIAVGAIDLFVSVRRSICILLPSILSGVGVDGCIHT